MMQSDNILNSIRNSRKSPYKNSPSKLSMSSKKSTPKLNMHSPTKLPGKISVNSSKLQYSRNDKPKSVTEVYQVSSSEDEEDETQVRDYPPTSIHIIQDVSSNTSHEYHPINTAFANYNEFIKLVFKAKKVDRISNIPRAVEIGRKMGLLLTESDLNPKKLKDQS